MKTTTSFVVVNYRGTVIIDYGNNIKGAENFVKQHKEHNGGKTTLKIMTRTVTYEEIKND